MVESFNLEAMAAQQKSWNRYIVKHSESEDRNL